MKIKLKIDLIYNLACPASPSIYQKDPVYTMDTAILGTKNILELAKEKKAIMFQASTSEVYGDPLIHPQKESYWGNVNPIGLRSCYDEGKRAAESYCYEYSRQGVEVRVGRIFNTYGPFMSPSDGRVVVNFILQALNNQDLTIYGDGNQSRSFCYIDDLVEAMVRYGNLKKKYFGPLNLGNPEEFTILELAEKILSLIPESKSKIVFRDLPPDDPSRRRPDISRAKEILNWQPKVCLEEGLKKTIAYFKLAANRGGWFYNCLRELQASWPGVN